MLSLYWIFRSAACQFALIFDCFSSMKWKEFTVRWMARMGSIRFDDSNPASSCTLRCRRIAVSLGIENHEHNYKKGRIPVCSHTVRVKKLILNQHQQLTSRVLVSVRLIGDKSPEKCDIEHVQCQKAFLPQTLINHQLGCNGGRDLIIAALRWVTARYFSEVAYPSKVSS